MGAEEKKELSVVEVEASCTTEFRSYGDDAWYSVTVSVEGETLRVKYLNFSEDVDNLFKPTDFQSLEELEEFEERFRPVSKQLQDNECRQLVRDTRVCACYRFRNDDVRFYDAEVHEVRKNKHSYKAGEELCLCTFILCWLHGPNIGNLNATTVENICVVQPALDQDPAVASFLKMARERTEFVSSCSISMSKGVSGLEMVAQCKEGSPAACRPDYLDPIQKEKQCAKRSLVRVCSPEVSCLDRRMEDIDLGGIKNVCMILIGNLDKELCPSTVTEFLRRHTSVSPRVFIFPSLSSEIYTRGAIILDSKKDFQKLCDFLDNPNHIITSSTGRPWVIIEKLAGLKKIKASIGTLVPISKKMLPKGKRGTSSILKVVGLGTQEFKIASDLKELFLEFSDHQKRLHKKLVLEERRICAAKIVNLLCLDFELWTLGLGC
ncbi:uncharacterized protein LOC133286564 [Gastrolobium bilobum]|uniref:uncharacterized protein LOC133286564 n=1 Tax=Gastrolobium bilobum TaxID=150636 RepID=UPI002AAF31F9|nr:uncharacterized protein LOC133286564 [Gastrolobium bilobum]XP_061339973.1 uncharacterized protein LOC133286564 [Gastrolobium bilobum]